VLGIAGALAGYRGAANGFYRLAFQVKRATLLFEGQWTARDSDMDLRVLMVLRERDDPSTHEVLRTGDLLENDGAGLLRSLEYTCSYAMLDDAAIDAKTAGWKHGGGTRHPKQARKEARENGWMSLWHAAMAVHTGRNPMAYRSADARVSALLEARALADAGAASGGARALVWQFSPVDSYNGLSSSGPEKWRSGQEERCEVCGEGASDAVALLKCSGCRVVAYCSKECQRKHWMVHKTICRHLQALAKKGSPSAAGSEADAGTAASFSEAHAEASANAGAEKRAVRRRGGGS
jgi:hypothetical protein